MKRRRYPDLATFFEQNPTRSHAWLAARLGVDRSYVTHLLNNPRSEPSLTRALQIAKLTGVPVASLAREDAA